MPATRTGPARTTPGQQGSRHERTRPKSFHKDVRKAEGEGIWGRSQRREGHDCGRVVSVGMRKPGFEPNPRGEHGRGDRPDRGARKPKEKPHAPRPPRCQGATMIHSRRRHGEEEQRGQRGCCGGRMPPYLRRGAPTRISHELSSPQQKVGERCGLSPSASRTFSVRRHLQPPRPFTSLAPVG